jgi:GT2 family glycosyltransferase
MLHEQSLELPAVQVVVTHWNDEETTIDCLEHLKKVEYAGVSVTVVDSGSTDGSGERIRRTHNWVRVVRIPENRGHAFAANVGASLASEGRSLYLFFLDNDAFVEPDCLDVLVGNLEATPQAAMACPLILSERNRDRVWYAGGYITFLGNARHKRMGKSWNGDPSPSEPTGFATSCALLVRRSVFEMAGGFNTDLGSYSEDLELSIKVRRSGYEILFVPNACVYHGESLNVIKVAGKSFRDYYTIRNRLYIIRKYGSAFQKSIGVICTILWYAVAHGVAYFLRGEWERTRALLLGVQDFFRGRLGWRKL